MVGFAPLLVPPCPRARHWMKSTAVGVRVCWALDQRVLTSLPQSTGDMQTCAEMAQGLEGREVARKAS